MASLSGALGKLLAPVMNVNDLGIPVALIHDTIFRILFNEGEVNISRFSELMGLHPKPVDIILSQMKQEYLVTVAKTGSLGSLSFSYALTDAGAKRARDAMERSQYIGRMPVSLGDYTKAILLQTKGRIQVSPDEVKRSLANLILPANFHRRIGPAINAGSSLFLYGPPGNGKTTIAESIAQLLAERGSPLWLPDTITIGGQFVRIFDPLVHELVSDADKSVYLDSAVEEGQGSKLKVDNRWRLFKRPSVMVGGELTMDALDLRFEPTAKVYEAPLQLKANGGMFLIDDFGRQQLSPQQLLNRWIVPLESGIDFLRLDSGQTMEVPFRELIVFSTNLDPGHLVDGAFLRRIQMKVAVTGPDERMFYQIFQTMCRHYQVEFDNKSFIHLLQKWYRDSNRVMQSVHPRDVIKTVVAICEYEGAEPRLSPQLIDEACISYFVDLNSGSDLSKTAASVT